MASGDQDQTRTAVLGGVCIAVLAVGWFVLSWRVEHTPAGDAFGEALGLAFGLLIVVSVVGSVLRRGRGEDVADDRLDDDSA
jgi:hypothetical protein